MFSSRSRDESKNAIRSRSRGGTELEYAPGTRGPPSKLHFADDVLLRDGPEHSTVRTAIPMVSEDEVEAIRNHLWPPCVLGAEFVRDKLIRHGHVVSVDAALFTTHGLSRPRSLRIPEEIRRPNSAGF